jgi:hypothetical protein
MFAAPLCCQLRAPFDPNQAVAECAKVLARYDVSVVRGDRYAGEWPKDQRAVLIVIAS